MRTFQPGSWNHLAARFDLFGTSVNFGIPAKFTGHFTGSGGSRSLGRGKKRKHQKPPRFCPIQLEPLEQRQLLSASLTQDLFAATSGTPFNSTYFNSNSTWILNGPTGGMYIVNDALFIPADYFKPNDVDLASVTTGTQNSVEQFTFNEIVGPENLPASSSDFGLVARANSTGTTYYGAELDFTDASGYDPTLEIYKSINNSATPLNSVVLTPAFSLGATYTIKFEVDSVNSTATDLFASVWQQGSTEPGWQCTTTDSSTKFNGANSTGYDGIFVNPYDFNSQSSTVSDYIESSVPGDMPPISNFSATPTPNSYNTSSFPLSATFSGTASVPTGDTLTSYTLNFGDSSSTTISTTTTSISFNISHTYTTAPTDAYTASLTITDYSASNYPTTSSTTQSIVVAANDMVSTDPVGTLTINTRGGNGVSSSNPLIVQFTSSGTPYSSTDPLMEYILNFGDGDISSYPINTTSGSPSSIVFDTAHYYTQKDTFFYPTLTLVGADGATTVIDAPSIMTTGSSNPSGNKAWPPTVTTSFNTANDNFTAVFSEDVGAALIGQYNSDYTATGEPLWSDSSTTAGSIAAALDIRNDNSGGSVNISTAPFSYNASNLTATWNLSSLVNTTSTSYTARLFADDIQDQAGNDLDGTGSGIGGDDATAHFGATYPNTDVTLFNGNTQVMTLVFAPSIPVIESMKTTSVGSTASTLINFNSSYESVLAPLVDEIYVQGEREGSAPVILEDLPSAFADLNGLWNANDVNVSNGAASITIPTQPYAKSILSTWSSTNSGELHISPDGGTDYAPFNPEQELINALEEMTGATSVNFTGNSSVSNAIYVGTVSQFTGAPFNFTLDTNQLGISDYIVRSTVGGNLFIVGGSLETENDAIDAFLQSLGMEEYGPTNSDYGINNVNHDIWQVTPNFTTSAMSGSWDIRQTPAVGYLDDNDNDGSNYDEQDGWDSFYNFNYGGGAPVADTQQGNMGLQPSQASIEAHPSWWATVDSTFGPGGTGAEPIDTIATFAPLGTINANDTFSITLSNSTKSETITITATSSDNSATGIVNALNTAILADTTDTFFESSSITVATLTEDELWEGSYKTGSWVASAPVLEMWVNNSSNTFTPTAATGNGSTATLQVNTYQDGELNFANPALVNKLINSYVKPWLEASTTVPGSVLSLAPRDGGAYDTGPSTRALVDSLSAYQSSGGWWWGYNAQGVLVSGNSQAYWNLVNELAQYILANEASYGLSDLMVGAPEYDGTAQPPSFPLEPNVIAVADTVFRGGVPYSQLEQLAISANDGAQVGVYQEWDIFYNNDNPTPSAFVPATTEANFAQYNDVHLVAAEGENDNAYGAEMPGNLIAGILTNNASAANATTMQTALTNFYTSMFGPAATNMEDYFVLFSGTAADPNLEAPPAMANFSGTTFPTNGGSGTVSSDASILRESFAYLDAASTSLTNAYNNGNNSSFSQTQYDNDQARVDQMRMYAQYMFDEYQLEYDYVYTLGSNKTPSNTSASFNIILNDLTNVVSWVDDLVSTGLIDTTIFDANFQGTYSNLSYFWSNDPNGSNGLATEGKGLLVAPGSNRNPTQTVLNGDWTVDEGTTANCLNVLNAPTNLNATTVSSTQIDLTWTDNDGGIATEYKINRSTSATSGYTKLTTVGAGVAAYTDSTVSASMPYYYEVQAVDGSTVSIFSNVANATTPSGLGAPSGLSATAASTSQINLSWTDNDGGLATGYDIDQSTNGTFYSQITTVAAGSTAYTNTGLTDGVNYYYEVQAFDGTTTSGFSAPANAVTFLAAPSGLSAAAASATQINLSWTDNDGGSATSYGIDQSTDGISFSQITTLSAGATAYTDTDLTDGTNYYYEVVAINSITTSAFSNFANAVTTMNAPSGLSASESNGANRTQSITVSWTNNSASQTGFDIDRSTNGTSYSQIATVSGSSTAYTDSAVFPDNTYYYEVAAFNAVTTSALSTSASAMTPTNEVGGVVTDYWYGSNSSAWSSQWTQTNNLTDGSAAVTINASDEGKMKFTRSSGTLSGNYITSINTVSYEDSFESVLVQGDTTGTVFELAARGVSTSDTIAYIGQLNFATSGDNLEVIARNSGATTIASANVGAIATDVLYDLEFEVVTANSTTTDLYAKVWATSGTEPTTWQISTHDSTSALQGVSGTPGMRFVATNSTESWLVDNFEAVNLLTTNQSYIDNFENNSTTGWTAQLTTSSYWTTGVNGNSIRYYINSTSYSAGTGGSLGALSLLTASADSNIGDFTMTVDVAAASSAAGSNYAIVFGYQTSGANAGDYYFLEFSATSGVTGLYKYVVGSGATLIQAANAPAVGGSGGGWIADTAYHAIKIQRTGTNISAWYDGQPLFTSAVSDSSFIGGEIGLGAINDSAYFDNVIVG